MISARTSPILVCMALGAISLGGNVGDVKSAFAETARRLQAAGDVTEYWQSRCYRTVPMGAAAGDAFLNAAAVFETKLAPLELLDRLQEIEQACGRVRTIRWGPRTLDLDLLLYGDERLVSERLTLPHPALWHRRFVLDPLVELIPDAVHPIFRETMRSLRDRLLERPLTVCVINPANDSLEWVEAVMSAEATFAGLTHPAVQWLPDDASSLERAALVFAGRDVSLTVPRWIRLPDDAGDALQLMNDVLTAALDEPVVEE